MQNIKEFSSKKFRWIDIDSATQDNLKFLKTEFDFDAEDLSDCAPVMNRQKIIPRKKYFFIVIQFPYYDHVNGMIKPTEVDFFLADKFIVSVHDDKLKPLTDYFTLCQTDQLVQINIQNADALDIFFHLITKLYRYCFPILNHINLDIERIEEDILEQPEEKIVADILHIKRNIVNFQRIMQTHRSIWQRFLDTPSNLGDTKFKTSGSNLMVYTKDIWDYLTNYKDTINALHQTQESMTTLKINEIMKTLTIFSVVVFPLTLLAAIFGMNTVDSMPFVNHQYGFWFIIAIMAMGMIIMFGFFKKKKWL